MASKDAPLRERLEEEWKRRNSGTPTVNDLWLFDLPIGRDRFAKAAAACDEVWKKPEPAAGARPDAGVNFVEASKVLGERFAAFNRYLDSEMKSPLDLFRILKWASEPAMANSRRQLLWGSVWEELYLLAVAHGRRKALSPAWDHLPTALATVELRAIETKKRLFDPTATFVAGSKDWGFHPKDAELIYRPFIDPVAEARRGGPSPKLVLLRARILMHHRNVDLFQQAQHLRRTATFYAMFRGLGLNLVDEIGVAKLSREIANTDPLEAVNRTWQEADRRYRMFDSEKNLFSVVWIDPGSRYKGEQAPSIYVELDAFPGHIFRIVGPGNLPAFANDQVFRLVARSLTALGEFLVAYLMVLGFVVDIITAGAASVTLRGLVYTFLKEKLIEAVVDKGLDVAKINSGPLQLLVQVGVGAKTATAGKKLLSAAEVEEKAAHATFVRLKSASTGAASPRGSLRDGASWLDRGTSGGTSRRQRPPRRDPLHQKRYDEDGPRPTYRSVQELRDGIGPLIHGMENTTVNSEWARLMAVIDKQGAKWINENAELLDDLAEVFVAVRDPKRVLDLTAEIWEKAAVGNKTTREAIEEAFGGVRIKDVRTDLIKEDLLQPGPFRDLALAYAEHGAHTHMFQELLVARVLGGIDKAREFRWRIANAVGPKTGDKQFWERVWDAVFDSTDPGHINNPETLGPILHKHLGLPRWGRKRR